MFHPDRDLKQVIITTLSEEGRSISYLSRELKKQGFDMHRLTLTGYLRAMTDLNILKEKDVPPAKIYTPVKGKERDIYLKVAETASLIYPTKAPDLTLYSLFKLFKRPIFKEELERAGIADVTPGVPARDEDVAETRKFLVKAGFKIPTSSKAYVPTDDYLDEPFQALLAHMILGDTGSTYLVRETKQTKLDL